MYITSPTIKLHKQNLIKGTCIASISRTHCSWSEINIRTSPYSSEKTPFSTTGTQNRAQDSSDSRCCWEGHGKWNITRCCLMSARSLHHIMIYRPAQLSLISPPPKMLFFPRLSSHKLMRKNDPWNVFASCRAVILDLWLFNFRTSSWNILHQFSLVCNWGKKFRK